MQFLHQIAQQKLLPVQTIVLSTIRRYFVISTIISEVTFNDKYPKFEGDLKFRSERLLVHESIMLVRSNTKRLIQIREIKARPGCSKAGQR